MKLSIIIPTYNEEKYLPNLLKSIKSQKYEDYEIIVADADSKDRTIEIAKKYRCKIVKGGIPGIGRNNGAKIAKGELLLFLDSDLELTENYLQSLIEEFEREKADIGITLMIPSSEKKRDKILHDLANWFMIAFEKIKPHGAGCYGIITKKSLHDKHEGFDEKLTFGEDTNYIEKLAKNNTFKVLRTPKVCVSTRRLEEEGLGKLARQYSKSTFNDFRGIRTAAEDLGYDFGHGPKNFIEEDALIAKLDASRITENIVPNNEKTTKNKIKEDINNIINNSIKTNESHSIMNTSISNNHSKKSPALKEKNPNLKKTNHHLKEKKYGVGEEKKEKYGKKRIIYSVCGEGMGHAVRSGVILEELIKKYDVIIFSSDRAYEYLNKKFENVFEIGGFNTVYKNNRVQNTKTLFNAIKETPTNLKEGYGILFKKAREFKPDIIISDFENYSSILSKIINVPLISIDNVQMITKTHIEYPPESQREMLKAKGVIKSYIIRPRRYIITSFFYPEIKNPEKTAVFPPVIRDKVRNLKTSYRDYILVYQTSSNNVKLVNALKDIDEKFIVYGFNKKEVDENLTFRKFNEDQIYDDMKNAKAVLTNGGFTFITESITLKKPIYSVPAKGNFEQLLNGFYVEKLGYGKMNRELNLKEVKEFLNNLERYQKTLAKVEVQDNSKILQEIERSIEKYSVNKENINLELT
ncbi:GalNAc(5)-diNAcBac-PP-undecaprenol beta-1,3-glucosyltransferase [Methanobrevibacter cuticularis]|uniref:GalNAc(5)-diNAcBac-PP-undecaprenol beta-1,3-glucosyltransferase n=1 Tax=Methanobrevibacter cuticularis TaxID=47311 RepID=A0A166CZ33_9EURY|nr:MJ1255/VC2487 family glycosyltransferase [Methanobrevibacter cuticularis]KZX15019.1 GalNAc(5)-diNAcBac-PP-undecaprenol beta-1,3-glucosyltransferase [Methanobrevibacter cuticularis]